MSGVGCVQADCPDVAAPNSHWGYTGNCICGTDDCVGNPNCVECYGPVDYGGFDKAACGPFCPNVKLVACVRENQKCPKEGGKDETTTTTTRPPTNFSRLFDQSFFDPGYKSPVVRAGIGGDIGGFFDRAGDWLREGWRRIVPDKVISVDDTDGLMEWTIVGHDGSYVSVKVGGGTFKVDSKGVEIKVKGLEVDTSSGGGYVKGFTIGEIGVEQSFDPKEVAADKVKDKLTEDLPGAEPVSADIDWDRISRDIADWFRGLKNQAADAVPEGLKERWEIIKRLTGEQGGN
jgi:hypothetical protein